MLVITLVALGIAVAVAWHLTRTVVGPVRRLTHGANAIRQGNFAERIDVASRDELGDLAAAFNEMAVDLAEFRRTNIGEVVRAKNTLEATLEALPDAVVLLDAAGQIQSMNRAARRVLASAGLDRPHGLADLRLDGLDLDTVAEAVATGASMAPPADLARTIRIEQGGSVQRLLPRVVPVTSLSPGTAGAVLLLYDVTDLVRLDEMRSELVAVASHELQTPLTTLRMTLLMLKEAFDVLPHRQRELVATSLIGVEQLTETVHEFLDLTRIEAGELRLNLEPVQVGAAIAESVRRVEAQANAQGVRLVAYLAPDLPQIFADPVRLRAVFDNILSNALKYTPEKGCITIETGQERTRAADGRARVSIKSPTRAPEFPRHFAHGSSTNSSASNTIRPKVSREHVARASVCICVDRSSSCMVARSPAAPASTSVERRSRLSCRRCARTRHRQPRTRRTSFNRPPAPDRVNRIQHEPHWNHQSRSSACCCEQHVGGAAAGCRCRAFELAPL